MFNLQMDQEKLGRYIGLVIEKMNSYVARMSSYDQERVTHPEIAMKYFEKEYEFWKMELEYLKQHLPPNQEYSQNGYCLECQEHESNGHKLTCSWMPPVPTDEQMKAESEAMRGCDECGAEDGHMSLCSAADPKEEGMTFEEAYEKANDNENFLPPAKPHEPEVCVCEHDEGDVPMDEDGHCMDCGLSASGW